MMFAPGFLGRYASKWSAAAEKRMRRLFEYLESPLNYGILWRLRRSNLSDMMMKVLVDADHGGCLDTALSTSGWIVYLSSSDGSTHALIDWASRRQQSTAKSTGEADTVAGAECLQSLLPILDVVESVVGSPVPCALLTDSDAARAAMKTVTAAR